MHEKCSNLTIYIIPKKYRQNKSNISTIATKNSEFINMNRRTSQFKIKPHYDNQIKYRRILLLNIKKMGKINKYVFLDCLIKILVNYKYNSLIFVFVTKLR